MTYIESDLNEAISEAQDRIDRAMESPLGVGHAERIGTPDYPTSIALLPMEGAHEPLADWQRELIRQELLRAGATEDTFLQNGLDGRTTAEPGRPPTSLQPGQAGSGGLLPGIAPLPQLDTRPAPLGTSAPSRAGTLAFDSDWEGGAFDLGKVVFDDIINRQQSGVRIGVLPMVVWQKQPRVV